MPVSYRNQLGRREDLSKMKLDHKRIGFLKTSNLFFSPGLIPVLVVLCVSSFFSLAQVLMEVSFCFVQWLFLCLNKI